MEHTTDNDDCIFCRIAQRQVPANVLMEDADTMVFKDVNPKAPTHLLVVPKTHLGGVSTLEEKDIEMVGKLVQTARKAAEKAGVSETGYRLVFNVGKHSGAEVNHLHLHILGGKQLGGMG